MKHPLREPQGMLVMGRVVGLILEALLPHQRQEYLPRYHRRGGPSRPLPGSAAISMLGPVGEPPRAVLGLQHGL